MNQNLVSILVRNWFRSIFILTIGFLLGGCASVKIKDPRNEELFNKEVKWKGSPLSVYVDIWGQPDVIEILAIKGLLITNDPVSNKRTRTLGYELLGTYSDGKLKFVPEWEPYLYFFWDQKQNAPYPKYDIVFSIGQRNFPEIPSATLERAGIKVVNDEIESPKGLFNDLETCQKALEDYLEKREVKAKNSNPDYYISGDLHWKNETNWPLWFLWDLTMAIPSMVLPIPLGADYVCPMEITLYDNAKTKVSSQRVDVEMRTIYYGLWSASKPIIVKAEAIHAAPSLVIEMIQECESNKVTNK